MHVTNNPANAMTPETEAPKRRPRLNQELAPGARFQYLFGLDKSQSKMGFAGIVILSTGIAVALFCSVWAIKVGVPYPLAIMAGYCALVGSACLCAVLLVVQKHSGKNVQSSIKRQPNHAAWNLVATFRVSDASRLWCDIEPGCPASQESIAWAQAMLDAIKRGELPICERAGSNRPGIDQERANPSWRTEIAREALKVWAQSHGHTPPFLQK